MGLGMKSSSSHDAIKGYKGTKLHRAPESPCHNLLCILQGGHATIFLWDVKFSQSIQRHMTHMTFSCSLVAVCCKIKQKLANPSDVLLLWIVLMPSLKEFITLCMDYWTKTPDLLNYVQLHSQSRLTFVEMQDSYLSWAYVRWNQKLSHVNEVIDASPGRSIEHTVQPNTCFWSVLQAQNRINNHLKQASIVH